MTRVIAILLFISVVWVQTPVAQLLKIHALVEHYHEHKTENRKLSVMDFLYMHYAHDTDNHPGHDRDMQLPFKQCTPISFAIGFIEQARFELSQKPVYAGIIKPLSHYRSPYHATEALAKIWQPPRA